MKIQTKQDPSPVAYHPDTITARLKSAVDWLTDRDTGTPEYIIGEDLQAVQDHIVRAVESYTALVEACTEALSWTRQDLRGFDDISPNEPMLKARIKMLKAALAAAKGQA